MAQKKSRSVSLTVSQAAPTPAAEGEVWYAEGLRFNCSQCGNCCSGGPGYVWISTYDMDRIAAYLKMDFDTFTRTYVRRIGNRFSLLEKFNYDCTFLKRENGKSMCMVYPVRPTQCRTWPFWDENLKSPQHWENAAAKCPGMCHADGKKFELAEIERRRSDTASPHE